MTGAGRAIPLWLLALALVVVAVHIVSFRMMMKLAWPTAVSVGIIAIVIVKHVGLLGSAYNRLRRRRGR